MSNTKINTLERGVVVSNLHEVVDELLHAWVDKIMTMSAASDVTGAPLVFGSSNDEQALGQYLKTCAKAGYPLRPENVSTDYWRSALEENYRYTVTLSGHDDVDGRWLDIAEGTYSFLQGVCEYLHPRPEDVWEVRA